MIKVGIYGATGYMGGEALRILMEHPEVKVEWATSREPKPVEYSHRNFFESGVKFIRPEEATECDAVFFATPAGNAMESALKLLKDNIKIIDLGADFRLKNISEWERVYGKKHACCNIVEEAVYGIPELHRDEIRKARVIANPGCYSSASIFGLAPLVKANLIDTDKIIIDGLSGTAGIGAELWVPAHHPEMGNNLVPYNVVDHRHTYEIEQELGNLTSSKVSVHFTTTYVPITRGILAICHCFPKTSVKRSDLLDLYKDFYRNEYFVKILVLCNI